MTTWRVITNLAIPYDYAVELFFLVLDLITLIVFHEWYKWRSFSLCKNVA
jgi:hypothetical protein